MGPNDIAKVGLWGPSITHIFLAGHTVTIPTYTGRRTLPLHRYRVRGARAVRRGGRQE